MLSGKGGGNLEIQNSLALCDDIGNRYARRNEYEAEVLALQAELAKADMAEKAVLKNRLKTLRQNRHNHAYNLKLAAFRVAEKQFLKKLAEDRKQQAAALDGSLPKRLRQLQLRLFCSGKKADFYGQYADLSWDTKLVHEQSRLEYQQLPEVIETYARAREELWEAKARIAALSGPEQTAALKVFKEQKKAEQAKYRQAVRKLKEKQRNRLISTKALSNGIQELNKKRQEADLKNSFALERKSLSEIITNKRFIINTGTRRQLKVLNSNISDLRRRIPVERRLRVPLFAFIGLFMPGLGQVLNRQYVKAALLIIGTLFIYIIAIPYALGYSNYQGRGIAGLVSLAAGARRIDKSLIFMIEGIVAIFMVLGASAILAFNFQDVFKTQRAAIRGIRPNNWFETRVKLETDGFPIMVSLPAFIVTAFIVLVPITTALLLSFTGMDPQNQSKFPWVGIANYATIAMGRGLAGSVFWLILGWTLVWTLVSTSMAILTGFGLALLANQERIKGKAFFRTVYLLPWAVPAFITIMFFSIMFAPNGALTEILESMFNMRIHVKTDPTLSRTALIMLQTWLGSSYVFLLATGVLQAIPGDLYEAAQIDGASTWQKLFKITIPIVLFQTAPLLVGQYTFNFNNFSIIWLFNGGGPFSPTKYGNLAGTTDLLISYIYKLTMNNQYQSIGAAITIVISLGLMAFAYIGFKNSKAFKEERL